MISEMQKEVWNEILDDYDDEIATINKPIIQEIKEKSKQIDKDSENQCPICGSKLYFTMGCKSCTCGFSYCG